MMTLQWNDILLYSGALLLLFMTPGPVWVALVARALSGGVRSAAPLAFGVVVGDVLWPLIAVFGLVWITQQYAGILDVLKWVAVAMFLGMGVMLIKNADLSLSSDSKLLRPGIWSGFIAGVIVIVSNPKAVLFYMGVLPGFFDLSRVTGVDIFVICFLSMIIPLLGNLLLAVFVGRARALITSPQARRRLNLCSGVLLVLVALTLAIW